MVSVNVIDDLLETINEFNDEIFDVQSSIEQSKLILEIEMNENPLSDCKFEEEKWYFDDRLSSTKLSIDFNKVKEVIRFNSNLKSEHFIQIIKCWVASLIEQGYSISSIERYYAFLQLFFTITKGLTTFNEDMIVDEFKSLTYNAKNSVCNSAFNFFDYYTEFDVEECISLLYSLKPTYQGGNARILPPSKDILIFSKILEHYFSKDLTENQYFKWFPVWLWWNLTTLIPIRPSEFCNIERNCISIKNGNFYIKLPRYKQKLNKRKIQILDTISIPEKLYRKIEHYQKCTERFGETDTLISYRSIPSYFNGILHDNNRHVYKRLNPNKFTLKSFKLLLKSFYENIVFGEYKIALKENDSSIEGLSITRKIKPGDTRHLAFINLYRQGYHAVEIARLGGHVSIYSQSHYYNHIEAFVDLEILELVQKVDLDTYSNKISNKESIQEHTVGMAFIEQFVLRPPKTDFKRKMIDGYCTYQEQLCPVNDCWECSEWWRISKEEFMEKNIF